MNLFYSSILFLLAIPVFQSILINFTFGLEPVGLPIALVSHDLKYKDTVCDPNAPVICKVDENTLCCFIDELRANTLQVVRQNKALNAANLNYSDK
jgi:hypothetical protein